MATLLCKEKDLMLKKPTLPELALLGAISAFIGLASQPMPAQTKTGPTGNIAEIASSTSSVVDKELMNVAAAHKVKVQARRAVYISSENFTLIHVPLQDIEKYKDADFTAGVPLMLIIVKQAEASGVLNGSYVVKVQFAPGASSGKAIYLDSTGAVAAERELLIRKTEPFPFSDIAGPPGKANRAVGGAIVKGTGPTPVGIPNITSTGCVGTQCYVDCAGWQPYRVLYFATN
jgi:hypothetical protein